VGLLCAAATLGSSDHAAAAPLPPPPPPPLAHRVDSYGGVIIDATALPSDAAFPALLGASLTQWASEGRCGVWLSVPLSRAALVAPAVAAGFIFHHAEPTHVMLTRWLPSAPSTLPANASHHIGVGAFVLNARGEVLVVQERAGPAARPGFWKLPTGLVNQGEDVHAAAVREVLEETGVNADFEGVIGVRQAHGISFGKDDLFFLCVLRLKPGADASPVLTPQEGEIAAAAWMPLDQFGAMPHVVDPNTVWGHLHVLSCEWAQGKYDALEARTMPPGTGRPGMHTVFTAVRRPVGEQAQGAQRVQGASAKL
jgi:8-oxo-dGTP pyrophosphatase MutT (NUDIX family)